MAELVLGAASRRHPRAGVVLVTLAALIFGGGLAFAFVEDARQSAERQVVEQQADAIAADVAATQFVRDSLAAMLEKERGRIARMDAELSDTAGFLE